MKAIEAKRVALRDVMELSGSPEQVFPLLCPVREYDWIPGWECVMIHSQFGVAEMDCLFRTDFPGEEGRIWQVSVYDPPRNIGFVSVVPGMMTVALRIGLEALEHGGTRATWTRVYTALGPRGEAYLERAAGGGHARRSAALEEWLETYLRTGRMGETQGDLHG